MNPYKTKPGTTLLASTYFKKLHQLIILYNLYKEFILGFTTLPIPLSDGFVWKYRLEVGKGR